MSTRGALVKILGSLPGDMLFKDRSRTWRVDALLESLESGAKLDEQAYVLHRCMDGRFAIVHVEPTGALSRTASFLEVK